MSSHPLVSVCIPTYNHGNYIKETIDSVLSQDFQDLEIVITDDCSTDNTVDVVRSVADDRIRLYRLDRNMGPSVAANNNITHAKGEFICLLPSDDLFEPNKISRQLDEFRRTPEAGAVFSRMRFIDEEGKPLERDTTAMPRLKGLCREPVLRHFFHEGNCLDAPTAMIRRDVLHRLGPVDPRLLQTQDFELWIRLCLLFEVSMVDETLVAYRIRARQANMDANTPDKLARIHWELPRILEIFLSWTDRDLFLRVFPEAKVHLDRGLGLRSALALMALQSPASWTRSFGIEALYRELGDPAAVAALGRSGYHFPDFFRLLAEVDPTRAKALEDITQRLTSARDWAQSQAERLASARDWAQSQADAWEARAGELEVKYQEAIRPKGLVHWLRTRLGV
jgi:glycosyltransferase involved in cell wall biosynthesis